MATNWLEILKTRIGYQGATSLADKLTAARAGYLDNINNANLSTIPNISTLSAARIGYLDNINQAGLLQVTAARAGYLDNIANAQLLNITAARLGYIDRLTLLAAGGAGELTIARVGYLDNINQAGLLQVTAVRAGKLDNLDATVSSRSSHTAADVRTSVTLVGDPANSIGKALYEIYITRLTAARATLLDEITAVRLTELDAANMPADIDAILGSIGGSTGALNEQAEAAVNITAIAASETDFLNLAVAATRYLVRDAQLKCADPGANTVTVRLYKLVNAILTVVDTFAIDTTNFATYHSLMDMFARPHLAGDNVKITVQASAGGPYAVTGSYSHGKNNV